MEDWLNLPLFPLNTVLFPGMVLPLHIFEKRYRQMIRRCLDERRPFGVLLGPEAGKLRSEGERPVLPYQVGTTAIIVGVSYLDDGRYNLVTIGDERFRLHEVRDEEAYLTGSAEPWPFEAGPPGLEDRLAPVVRARFDAYLALLSSAQGHKMNIESIPEDPRGLALLIAVAAQVSMPEKQRLLCQASIADLLTAEQILLRREDLVLNYISRTQAEPRGTGYSGWLATN